MSKKSEEKDPLRAEAEALLARTPEMKLVPLSAEEFLHEFRVHQAELEMQNEQLRQSQFALEESRDRYVDLYDFAPVGYLTLNREGMITEINLTGAAMLGVERKKLLNKHFSRFIRSANRDQWRHHFLSVLRRDGRQSCELELQRSNGSSFQAKITSQKAGDTLSSNPIDDASDTNDTPNTHSRLRMVITDITDIKAAQKALWEKTQLLDSIVENIPNMIFLKRASDLRFELFNKAGENLLGYSRSDLLGKGDYDFWPKEQADWFTAEDRRVLASVKNTEIPEEPIKTATGETRYLQTWKVALRDENGAPSHLLGISVDITERKRAEQQLRELTAHLQTVREEEKARIAREIHDDLGGRLAALKMDASWMASKLPAAANTLPLLECSKSMIEQLDTTVKSLRRIIADLRPTIIDDLGLLEAIKWHADQFHKRTGIECQFSCPSSEDKENNSQFDNTLSITLFRIFQEALTNVARHSGASRVEAEFQPGINEVVLSISDNGSGLPEGHTIASTSYGIRGMRERAEQLGGKIDVNSLPGGGFNVTATIPLSADPLKEALAKSETRYRSLFENLLMDTLIAKCNMTITTGRLTLFISMSIKPSSD